MNQKEFLSNQSIQSFVRWLSVRLDCNEQEQVLLHSWRSRSIRSGARRNEIREFFSILDAFNKYHWQGKNPISGQQFFNFYDNADCLNQLRDSLNKAIKDDDAEACYKSCIHVLEWGGVSNRPVAETIKQKHNIAVLPQYLSAISEYLKSDPSDDLIFKFFKDGVSYSLQVDSGTTKIYSLLSETWAIYDGRVGSALGLLVSKWANDCGIDLMEVPELLRFSYGHGHVSRNPNPPNQRVFPLMNNQGDQRLKHNLYANWLIQGVLSQPEMDRAFGQLGGHGVQARAFEAALFMLGYAVTNN